MPMTFTVRLSHVVCVAAGFASAAALLPSRPQDLTQTRAHVERELTSGTTAMRGGPSAAGEPVGVASAVAPVAEEAEPALAVASDSQRTAAKAKGKGRTHATAVREEQDENVMHRSLRTAAAIRVGPSYGAGVLVSDDGLVLTVNHVLEEGKTVRVSVAGQPWQDAKIVSRDVIADLALLKVKLTEEGPQRAATLSTVTGCRPGDNVFTIGSPASMHFSLTRGVLSFVGRRFGGYRYIQTDIPTQPGNSGGALFNEAGEVVGLMTFILRNGQNLAFAIPVDYARAKFPELQALARGGQSDGTFSVWAQAKIENPL